MLDRKKYDKNMSILLTFKNVKTNNAANEFFYNLVKNDFTDEEFGKMCVDICKTEDLYNKYPDPKLFYDRKKASEENILVEVGTFYLDETIPEYKEAFAGLSFDEADKLGTAVWNWIMKNKRGEMISKQFVVDRIKQFRPTPVERYELPESFGKKLIDVIKKI